jgi:hypothetical protein
MDRYFSSKSPNLRPTLKAKFNSASTHKKINEEDFTLICGNIKDLKRIFDDQAETSSSSDSHHYSNTILGKKRTNKVADKFLLPLEIFK